MAHERRCARWVPTRTHAEGGSVSSCDDGQARCVRAVSPTIDGAERRTLRIRMVQLAVGLAHGHLVAREAFDLAPQRVIWIDSPVLVHGVRALQYPRHDEVTVVQAQRAVARSPPPAAARCAAPRCAAPHPRLRGRAPQRSRFVLVARADGGAPRVCLSFAPSLRPQQDQICTVGRAPRMAADRRCHCDRVTAETSIVPPVLQRNGSKAGAW